MLVVRPEPYSDAVHICGALKKSLEPLSTIEAHLFAYLACILGLWKGRPLADWGYSFVVTSEGFPYSPEFEIARAEMEPRGLIRIDDHGRMQPLHEAIDQEIDLFFSSQRWSDRRELCEAAVGCALAFPTGSIRFAIGRSPGMKSANLLKQSGALFSEYDVEKIYKEYSVVREAIEGDSKDMLAPAVVWLSAYLLDLGAEPELA